MVTLSLLALYVYSAFGVLFALAFCWVRLPANSTVGLRVILMPGAFALWPYLLFRWSRHRNDTAVAASA